LKFNPGKGIRFEGTTFFTFYSSVGQDAIADLCAQKKIPHPRARRFYSGLAIAASGGTIH
jgi:hypothetical protein